MLTALNVPPMGLFYPMLLVPDVYPPPPRSWFNDYEDVLEDPWHIDFPARPDMSDTFYPNVNVGLPMWDSYPVFSAKPKKEEKFGLAEAITNSILLAGRIDLQRKLFCSIQLLASTSSIAGHAYHTQRTSRKEDSTSSQVGRQTSETSFDSRKAFIGSIIEHADNLPKT